MDVFKNKTFVFTVFIAMLIQKAAIGVCWEQAAASYNLDPLLLKAIAWQESRGWTKAVGPKLKDGNRALGVMQINTIHLPTLAKKGIRREDLFDPCINQKVGAWILADCVKKFGPKWKAVGCYYAGPGSKNVAAQEQYVRSVQRFYADYKIQDQQRDAYTNSVM